MFEDKRIKRRKTIKFAMMLDLVTSSLQGIGSVNTSIQKNKNQSLIAIHDAFVKAVKEKQNVIR